MRSARKKQPNSLASPTIRCPIGAAPNPVTGNRLFREAEKHGFQKKQRNNGFANWKKRSKTPLPNRKGRCTLVVRYVMNLFQLYFAPAAIP